MTADVIPPPNDDGFPKRLFLGRGIWTINEREVYIELPGWYRWEGQSWERDEDQTDALDD